MKHVALVVAVCIFLLPKSGFGIEFRRQVQDVRSLGMGNTGIAGAHTSGTIFYNPAALANIKEGWIDLPSVQAIYSKEAKSFYKDIAGKEFLESEEERKSFMEEYIGKEIYVQADVGISLFFNFDKKGITVGGNWIYERIYDYEVNNPIVPEIDAFERFDLIRQIGFSYPIGLGQFVLGLAAKTVERTEKTFVYTTSDLIAKKEFPVPDVPDVKDGKTANGRGVDIGILWRVPTRYRISFGAVWKSAVDMGDDVTNIPEESAVGLSTTHAFGLVRWSFALDLRDLSFKQGSEDDKSRNRRIHAGTELSMFPTSDLNYILSLRAGFNQGYLSTGAELRLGNSLVLGYARYNEEIGEHAGDKESERTAMFVSLGF